jgi:hypothetical protein
MRILRGWIHRKWDRIHTYKGVGFTDKEVGFIDKGIGFTPRNTPPGLRSRTFSTALGDTKCSDVAQSVAAGCC